MAEFLDMYSVQHWLESCPQAYLEDTEYGHEPGENEPELVLKDPVLREQALRVTVQMVVGERAALAASSGLVNAAPDEASKRFLATQTLDEARHVEIFTQRLYDLGVKKQELEDTIQQFANPNLMKFAELLLEKVDKRDFVAGVVGQNIVLEGLAFTVFEMSEVANRSANPKFAHTLQGTIADERRHVGFGENRIGALIRDDASKKPEVERLQKEMSYYMLATFADQFRGSDRAAEQAHAQQVLGEGERRAAQWQGRDLSTLDPAEMESLLAETVLKEFKVRLDRIGLEYQSPVRP